MHLNQMIRVRLNPYECNLNINVLQWKGYKRGSRQKSDISIVIITDFKIHYYKFTYKYGPRNSTDIKHVLSDSFKWLRILVPF